MKRPLFSLLAGSALLVGCATFTATTPEYATLSVRAAIGSGAYQPQGVGVATYTAASIEHLVVSVYLLDGSSETAVLDSTGMPLTRDIASGSLGTPITCTNLRPNTTYRLKAQAFNAAGKAPTNLISVDALSIADVTVTNDDRPAMGKLPVRLKNVAFSGEATGSGVVFGAGGMATASETIATASAS